MSASPLISVIIPTYNRAELLRRALNSILRQTFSDYEIIVVDDGSTDCTQEQVARLSREWSASRPRIRCFFQKNQGKSVALNHGLSEAKGEWIAFQDSDDVWLPAKLEQQFRALRRFAPQSEACFTNARYVSDPSLRITTFEHGRKSYPGSVGVIANSDDDPILRFWIYMQTVVVHSRVMKKVGGFDPALWTGQDADFIFRLSFETQLCYINDPLVFIDRTPNRSIGLTEDSVRMAAKTSALRQQMLEKWIELAKNRGAANLVKRLRSDLRSKRSQQANRFLIDRKYREARRCAALAARAELTPGLAAKWALAALAPAVARRLVIRRQSPPTSAPVAGGAAASGKPRVPGSSPGRIADPNAP